MNQKISNAPVIGMIVAIMLLTISAGVNIWLYNENNALDDIQEETIATLTIGELEYLTNMNWRCFAYAATVWDAYIERVYTTERDDEPNLEVYSLQ